MNEKLTSEQRDWIVAEAAANFRHHGVFRLKLFEETLNAHTPEDEPSRIEHGTCVTNCPTCGWQGRENESHTAYPTEDER